MHKYIFQDDFPAFFKPNSWLAHAWQTAQQFKSQSTSPAYIGRFAPSPSGLLHQGSLIAALASYLHARWHGGDWLVRIEDVDSSRCKDEFAYSQLKTLRDFGFEFPAEVMWQSKREAAYQAAFDALLAQKRIYPCSCSRREIADSRVGSQVEAAYLGMCRDGRDADKPIRSWRFRVDNERIDWQDELGEQHIEHLELSTGDFVIKRAEGDWAYQLAVVVDDGAQHITHVVRGVDLLESTARQIALQRALNLPTPIYNHVPILLNSKGEKLSKRDQAPALEHLSQIDALQHAWQFLGGEPLEISSVTDFWRQVLRH